MQVFCGVRPVRPRKITGYNTIKLDCPCYFLLQYVDLGWLLRGKLMAYNLQDIFAQEEYFVIIGCKYASTVICVHPSAAVPVW